jgi:hypothetical protein
VQTALDRTDVALLVVEGGGSRTGSEKRDASLSFPVCMLDITYTEKNISSRTGRTSTRLRSGATVNNRSVAEKRILFVRNAHMQFTHCTRLNRHFRNGDILRDLEDR